MAANSPPSDCILPGGLYPFRAFKRITRISDTTLWRRETVDGVKLPRLKVGGKVFVRGVDAIWWLEECARLKNEGPSE